MSDPLLGEVAEPLQDVVGYLIRRTHSLFIQHWQTAFTLPSGQITPVQGGMLILIRAQPGLTQAMLARSLRVDDATLVQSVARLRQLGYVGREQRADDRRVFTLSLTPAGEAAVREVEAFLEKRDDELLAALSADERSQLRRLLGKAIAGAAAALAARDGGEGAAQEPSRRDQ